MIQFDKKYLRQLQNDLFSSVILVRGKHVYQNNAIVDLKIDEDSQKIIAKVQGSSIYKLEINYSSARQFRNLSCNCPYSGFCKHLAAIIYYFLDATKTETSKVISFQKPNKTVFKNLKTNSFRTISFIDSDKLIDTVNDLRPNHHMRELEYIQDFSYRLQSDNSLIIKSEIAKWYSDSVKSFIVEVVFMEKAIQVKCNSCEKKSNLLCGHVFISLKNIIHFDPFISLLNKQSDYQGLKKSFSQQENLSEEVVETYFNISFNYRDFTFLKKEKNFLTSSQLSKTSSQFVDLLSGNRIQDHDVLGNKAKSEKFGNALWWSYSYHEIEIMPSLLEGKMPKHRSSLSSNVDYASNPHYWSKKQRIFYHELLLTYTNVQSLPIPIQVSKVLKFLNEHINILRSCITYIGNRNDVLGSYNSKMKKSGLSPITFNKAQITISFELRENKLELLELEGSLLINNKKSSISDLIHIHPLFIVDKDSTAYLYTSETDYGILKSLKQQAKLIFPKSSFSEIASSINHIKTYYKFENKSKTKIETKLLYGGKKELYFTENGQNIIIKPYINFEDQYKQNALSKQIENQLDPVLFDIQGENAEKLCIEIENFHESFARNLDVLDFYSITVDEFLKDNWFLEFFNNCKANDITVFGSELLENFKFNKNRGIVSVSISSGIDWFDTKLDISFGKLKVPLKSWIEMVKNNQKYVKLSDGTLGLIPEEWLEKLTALYNVSQIDQENITISKYQFSTVNEHFSHVIDEKAKVEISKKINAFNNYKEIRTYHLPKIVTAQLRSYQNDGYRWLRFLDEYEFGGCLADDMGLGKTLQIISLLAFHKVKRKCFALVVVPNSLIFNWANEIEKFCPTLKYLVHHGPNRNHKIIKKTKFDVIISTYGTTTADIENLSEINFHAVILDESQAIKNANSKRYKAVKQIKAKHRFVMTGTPIENNTFDLYSQLNFVNPGLLGTAASFKKKFSVPIDSKGNNDQAALLRRIIHPFILRRTKEQVASDLPEKTESVILCEMGTKQRKYYDSVKNDIKNSLNSALKTQGLGKAKFQVLEGLLRLRQISNSPRLIDKEAHHESVKIKTLVEHIMSNNMHKCLVFSQFVGMLQLIKEKLEEMQITYAYLDGSTKDRQGQVDYFQKDKKCTVFLISLKAGNTGLNLTAAEYVYIVDPWWNPAVESQAIDRTHRIGQVNNVFAYRLVCKDTIEEKILQLQAKKKTLADDIIRADESVLKSLTKNDLLGLFD